MVTTANTKEIKIKRVKYCIPISKNIGMPELSNGYLECIKTLIKLDKSWIPTEEGYTCTYIQIYIYIFFTEIEYL